MALASDWPRKALGFNLSLYREFPASNAKLKYQKSHTLTYLSVLGCFLGGQLDQSWGDTDGPKSKLIVCWAAQLPLCSNPSFLPSAT